MEDFSTVIWVIAIVAAMVFNGVSKARKQAKKSAPQPHGHTGEAWPSWDTKSAEELEHQAAPALPTGTEPAELQSMAPQMAPSAGFGETAPETADFRHSDRHTPHRNAGMARVAADSHAISAHTDEQDDVLAEITEDFDLRRAVIYSEILKPKFDE